MERLDSRENSQKCEYTLIGGSSCKLTRQPSSLAVSPIFNAGSHSVRCHQKSARGSSSSVDDVTSSRPNSSMASVILKWSEDDVLSWLSEVGLEEYQVNFRANKIRCGETLLALEEEHLKEMDVSCVGHRLELVKAINELRKEAGLVCKERFVDISTLMIQIHEKRSQDTVSLYPQRIILIRHGESEGNVDNSLYAKKPDRQMQLTAIGTRQAYAAGAKLREMIQEESVCFYVSPFSRSRQTYEQIRQSFNDEQVLHVREDPRIREQEWGNFQDPSTMLEAMKERRKVGSFYYRFLTGESGADVYDRVSTFLETLYRDMEKGGCGSNAVMVSHGLFCRLFLMRYYHWKVEKFHKLWNFENCQYAVMEKQPGGSYRLISELKSDP